MSDYERYGDYNEIDDAPKSKNPIIIVLKILIAVVCVSVIGVLAFRMILFSSYPRSVSNIYYNDKLIEFYNETSGDINAKTQKLRAPYSDSLHGYFFCDYLIVIEDIKQLQITVRYNKASVGYIGEELGLELNEDESAEQLFSYRLTDNLGRSYEPSDRVFDKRAMYRYEKLVFDEVDFSTAPKDDVNWIRLEVFVESHSSDEPYAMVAIYENNETYSRFEDYALSKKEMLN